MSVDYGFSHLPYGQISGLRVGEMAGQESK